MKTKLPDGLVNFTKCSVIAKHLEIFLASQVRFDEISFLHFQSVTYDIEPSPMLQDFLKNCIESIEVTEAEMEELYQRSLKIEPLVGTWRRNMLPVCLFLLPT